MTNNPFFEGTDIPDEFFCDREEETKALVGLITSGCNIVLKAPRRIGKSSLIKHVLKQKEVKSSYNTFYADILGTLGYQDFCIEICNAFLENPVSGRLKFKEAIRRIPGSIYLEGEADPTVPTLKARLGFAQGKADIMSLDVIFDFLEKTEKPNIFVLDEFQQITVYKEPMAAILRSRMQKMNNTKFIFSGSSRKMLNIMFNSENEPFYKSSEPFDLDILSKESYRRFCRENFGKFSKRIENEAIDFAYFISCANTYEVQKIMRHTFNLTQKGEIADISKVKQAIIEILKSNGQLFREKINMIGSATERAVMVAVALEGVAERMLSKDISEKYGLPAQSTVQYALEKLSDERRANIITRTGNSYRISEKMLELWIADHYGVLDLKFSNAEEQFNKEREAVTMLNLPEMPGIRQQ